MVRRDAVGQTVRPAGVFSDVTAERTGALAGWVRRVVEATGLGGLRKLQINHSGLDDG